MYLAKYDEPFLLEHFLPRSTWQPFPRAADRPGWDCSGRPAHQWREANECVARAAHELGRPWPQTTAGLFMEYARTGNRAIYEEPYFQKRIRLARAVVAECLEFRGRFMDEIIEGVWSVLSEPTWAISAHAERQPGDPLPSPGGHTVALFSAQTALLLSETAYLLHEEVQTVSPSVIGWIVQEVDRRIVTPTLEHDWGWLEGHNNWTPWCSSSILGSAMYLLDDPQRLVRLARRLMDAVDRFIARYGDDGGCDEGPGYWSRATGSLCEFLEYLHSRTGGAIDIYGEKRIRNMGHYIADAHLAGPWFMNFADAGARPHPDPSVVWRLGERLGDEAMQQVALLGARKWDAEGPRALFPSFRRGENLGRALRDLFWLPAVTEPPEFQHAPCRWYSDLQVLISRECERDGHGLVLAAKAGHNAENHNHNDVGQFILVLDGYPVVIDVGQNTYTRQTFGPQRYQAWTIGSRGHNVPLVNGCEQQGYASKRSRAALPYRARGVRFEQEEVGERLAMDLASAYGEEAGFVSLERTFHVERNDGMIVRLNDRVEVRNPGLEVQLPLYSPCEISTPAAGQLVFHTPGRPLVMDYPADLLDVRLSRVPLDDPRFKKTWEVDRLSCARLRLEASGTTAEYELLFLAGVTNG